MRVRHFYPLSKPLLILPLVMVLGLLLAGPAYCLAQADSTEELIHALLVEAPQKWADYGIKIKEFQGTISIEATGANGSRSLTRIQIKGNGSCKLAATRTENFIVSPSKRETFNEDLFAFNTQYSFNLRRRADGEPWVLIAVQPRNQGLLPSVALSFPTDDVSPADYLLGLSDITLRKLLGQSTFRISAARHVCVDTHQLVEIVFENKTEPGKPVQPAVTRLSHGRILLDPAHYWRIHSCTLHMPFGVNRIQYTYKEVNGIPVPVSRVREIEIHTATLDETGFETTRYDLSAPVSLPSDDEFRLSAFGFIEPFGVTWPRPTPWFLYFSAGGFGLFFLALFLWRVLAKRQARGVA